MDIQLYDTEDIASFAERAAVIAYCSPASTCNYGNLTTAEEIEGTYRGLTYRYSGWEGISGDPGREANRALQMSAYGFDSGTATVFYTYM